MDTIEKLIQRVQKTQHGFLDIQNAATEVVAEVLPKKAFVLPNNFSVRNVPGSVIGNVHFWGVRSPFESNPHISKTACQPGCGLACAGDSGKSFRQVLRGCRL